MALQFYPCFNMISRKPIRDHSFFNFFIKSRSNCSGLHCSPQLISTVPAWPALLLVNSPIEEGNPGPLAFCLVIPHYRWDKAVSFTLPVSVCSRPQNTYYFTVRTDKNIGPDRIVNFSLVHHRWIVCTSSRILFQLPPYRPLP